MASISTFPQYFEIKYKVYSRTHFLVYDPNPANHQKDSCCKKFVTSPPKNNYSIIKVDCLFLEVSFLPGQFQDVVNSTYSHLYCLYLANVSDGIILYLIQLCCVWCFVSYEGYFVFITCIA